MEPFVRAERDESLVGGRNQHVFRRNGLEGRFIRRDPAGRLVACRRRVPRRSGSLTRRVRELHHIIAIAAAAGNATTTSHWRSGALVGRSFALEPRNQFARWSRRHELLQLSFESSAAPSSMAIGRSQSLRSAASA